MRRPCALPFVIDAATSGIAAIEFTDVRHRAPTFHGFAHVIAAGATLS
jgi:hypothetical protein